MAVILGEAIWGLIVSVMNNVVGPGWGMSWANPRDCRLRSPSGPITIPTCSFPCCSFVLRRLVAAVLNYFFQAGTTKTIRTVKSSVPAAAVEPARVFPQPTDDCGADPNSFAVHPARAGNQGGAGHGAGTRCRFRSSAACAGSGPCSTCSPAPPITESTAARPLPTAPVARPAATKPSLTPKAEPPEAKKPKEVHHNIVGEPMPSDDD